MLRTEVLKETKISDTMVLLRLFDYQGALTVRYHRQRSFYRRRLFAAYFLFELVIATIGTIATTTWIGVGLLIQRAYQKYYRPINIILSFILLECIYGMLK